MGYSPLALSLNANGAIAAVVGTEDESTRVYTYDGAAGTWTRQGLLSDYSTQGTSLSASGTIMAIGDLHRSSRSYAEDIDGGRILDQRMHLPRSISQVT
jgi:hypothetical protein